MGDGPLFVGTVTMRGSGATCDAAVDDLTFHFNNDSSSPTSDELSTNEYHSVPAATSACTSAGGSNVVIPSPDPTVPRPINTVGQASDDTRCSITAAGVYWTTVSVVFPCSDTIASVPGWFPDPNNAGN